MNLRLFTATPAGRAAVWWFGGGFDLTPYYGFDEDCVHWHEHARAACAPLGRGAYARFKKECDAYFLLKHRGEPRGIGGTFFDDLAEPDFETVFAFVRAHGEHFLAGVRADPRATEGARPTASASATSSSGGAGATSSSTCSTTAARSTASSRAGASRACWPRCRPRCAGATTGSPSRARPRRASFERYLVPRDWVDPEGGARSGRGGSASLGTKGTAGCERLHASPRVARRKRDRPQRRA